MKIEDFRSFLRENSLDSCVLADNDPSIFYFSGVEMTKGYLFIPKDKEQFLISPKLESEKLEKNSGMKVFSYSSQNERLELLRRSLKGSICINKDEIKLRQYELLSSINKSISDASEKISSLRQIKTKEELELISNACKSASRIITKCADNFDFRTEREVAEFLEDETRKGGNKLAFETIVASGRNSSMPHYTGNEKIKPGFCIIDFGVSHKGYCSDVTRTIFIGRASRKERAIYEKVLSSQEKGISAIKEGAIARDIDQISRNALGEHSDKLIHTLGHQLGISVHDVGFRLSPESKDSLRAGMIFTVEPGVYFPGKFGIRIEDDIAVEKKGCRILTDASKTLIEIK